MGGRSKSPQQHLGFGKLQEHRGNESWDDLEEEGTLCTSAKWETQALSGHVNIPDIWALFATIVLANEGTEAQEAMPHLEAIATALEILALEHTPGVSVASQPVLADLTPRDDAMGNEAAHYSTGKWRWTTDHRAPARRKSICPRSPCHDKRAGQNKAVCTIPISKDL